MLSRDRSVVGANANISKKFLSFFSRFGNHFHSNRQKKRELFTRIISSLRWLKTFSKTPTTYDESIFDLSTRYSNSIFHWRKRENRKSTLGWSFADGEDISIVVSIWFALFVSFQQTHFLLWIHYSFLSMENHDMRKENHVTALWMKTTKKKKKAAREQWTWRFDN